jgi:alginate O-acetyltransferase complex protein AlgI
VVFSSLRYFLFLAGVLTVLAPDYSHRAKKLVLCAASCFFYAAWDPRYLGLLLLVSIIDYACAVRITRSTDHRARRLWLMASVVSNLGILGYFKYANFFVDNVNALLKPAGLGLSAMHVLLPAGISFYTFKSMSYTIDVFRNEIPTTGSQLDYTMFVTFFPELIAGPIVRASVFLPQMERTIGPTRQRMIEGASLFGQGLAKKLLVADHLGTVADAVFGDPGRFAPFTVWCGLLAYTFQIYCDFSGYSDMAIGSARMVGYDLPENFNMPYLATSVAEFWRRWHITLSQWLRDYLYVALGGNRKGTARTYANLMVTMLLGGLWHGASWNFVLWGFLHGTALALHRAWRTLAGDRQLPPVVAWALTFAFTMLCWIPFRSPNVGVTRQMLGKLFGLEGGGGLWYPEVLWWSLLLLAGGHLIGMGLQRPEEDAGRFRSVLGRLSVRRIVSPISGVWPVFEMRSVAGTFVAATFLLSIYFFGAANSSPFIYFQF